jgi:hypothetical protein
MAQPQTAIRGRIQAQPMGPRPMTGRPASFQIGAPGARAVPTANEKGFRPLMGGALGAVRLAQAPVNQRPFLGQETVKVPDTGTVTTVPRVPNKLDQEQGPEEAGQALESNWRRKAWGHFRRMDAAEMAAYLRGIEERMDQVKIPRGIVEQIRKRLESFSVQAKTDTEVLAIEEQDVAALDNAIMYLEQTESAAGSGAPSITTTAAVVAGLGLLTVLLVG